MSSFTENPVLEMQNKWVRGRRVWSVYRPYEYHVGSLGSGVVVYIEKGSETDLASIPRPARWVFPPDGKYAKAATIHDDLYKRQMIFDNGVWRPVTRLEADNILLEAMRVSGVPEFDCQIVYHAVRLGGTRGWNNHRKELAETE